MTARADKRNLKYTLVIVAIFSAFVVYSDESSGFGPFIVGSIAFLSSLGMLFAGVGFSKRRSTYLLSIVAGTAIILFAVYALTAGNGSPALGNQIGYTCTNAQIPNATSPSGFTNGSICTNNSYYSDFLSVAYNTIFWFPLVGAVIYAMPVWVDPVERNFSKIASRNLKGSVVVGTLLLLTFGLTNYYPGYLFTGLSPLNPFFAYAYCDSSDFGVLSCVQVNSLFYFIDYLFWIALASLVSLIASEFIDSIKSKIAKKNRTVPGIGETELPPPLAA